MKQQADQRLAVRRSTEATIICRPYASSGAVRSADGVMRNFSSDGSYIETAYPFRSGTILIVRMVGCLPPPSPEANEKPRSICVAEIKWLQDLSDGVDRRYGMGLRYLD